MTTQALANQVELLQRQIAELEIRVYNLEMRSQVSAGNFSEALHTLINASTLTGPEKERLTHAVDMVLPVGD